MGIVRKIKLNDNTTVDIHDSRVTTANAHIIPFWQVDSTSTSTDFSYA